MQSDNQYESLDEIVDEEVDPEFYDEDDEVTFLTINFPRGETYAVPAVIVADDRAQYYARKDHPDDEASRQECFLEEREYALNDRLELLDWVRNNMNWEDLEPWTTRIVHDEQPLEEQWRDAEIDVERVPVMSE